MLDGKTGKPRTIINIEKASRHTCEETGNEPRFRRFRGVGSEAIPMARAG
jgi:hypothetical protein